MPKGTVKWFDFKKGFGFVVNEDGRDVFVHYSNIQCDGFRTLKSGQIVEFSVETSLKGLLGKEVHIVGQPEKGMSDSPGQQDEISSTD